MVRPLGTVDPADEENIARLGWLKVADDECFQPQTDDEVPLLEPGLPFSAVSTDGGEYSSDHGAANLWNDDKSCYSSELGCSAAVNVVAKHAGWGSCSIEAITIRTPVEGYNSPVGQAIVFASLGVPCLEKIGSFDSVKTHQDYNLEVSKWSQQVQADPCMPKPIAFVSTRGRNTVTVPATITRSSRYAVVKLLRPGGSGDNIDVEYVGLHGWAGRRCCPCRMLIQE